MKPGSYGRTTAEGSRPITGSADRQGRRNGATQYSSQNQKESRMADQIRTDESDFDLPENLGI
jgi:hypothetical protein